VATQFTGAPDTVVAGLDTLRRVTGADELLITTITHDHADRVRSYELLADAWERRGDTCEHRADACEHRADACERRADARERRADRPPPLSSPAAPRSGGSENVR
jgi:hypothetical protein